MPQPAAQQLRWIRPPQQGRSRKSYDRLLDAAEALLAERSFDEITIADLVARARSSIGVFYSRFSDKEALLDALYDRHQRESIATMERAFDPERWKGASVRRIVESHVDFMVRLYRENRGLLRALVLRGYAKGDWRYRDRAERERLSVARIGKLLAARKSEIGHPDPKTAAQVGFVFVLATLREKILFAESTSSALRIGDRRLARELARAYLAYLEVRIGR